MDALISLVYTIIDSVCVCLFLDAFASHRWRDHRFLVGVIVQTILMYASIEFNAAFLNRNQIIKILLILLTQHPITMTGSTVRKPRSPTRTFTSITSPANHAAKVKTVAQP